MRLKSTSGPESRESSRTETMSSARRWSAAWVIGSMAFTLFVLSFFGSLKALPYETSDSAGRTMGFNDVLSSEHYGIIISGMSWQSMVRGIGRYEVALLGVQTLVMVFLLTGRAEKWLTRSLFVQPLLFPLGILGLLSVPLWLADMAVHQRNDREFFIDLPFASIMSQGAWLWTCAILFCFRDWSRIREAYARLTSRATRPTA